MLCNFIRLWIFHTSWLLLENNYTFFFLLFFLNLFYLFYLLKKSEILQIPNIEFLIWSVDTMNLITICTGPKSCMEPVILIIIIIIISYHQAGLLPNLNKRNEISIFKWNYYTHYPYLPNHWIIIAYHTQIWCVILHFCSFNFFIFSW